MLEVKREFDISPNGTKVKAIANLLYYLVNIYSLENARKNIKKKLDGKEIVVAFPALEGAITFKVMGERVVPYIGASENAVGRFALTVKEEDLMPAIEDIIKTPGTNMGIIKLVVKYLLMRKASVRGSLGSLITFLKTIMIGKHKMYKISYE